MDTKIVLFFIILTISGAQKTFKNYKVYDVVPKSEGEVDFVLSLGTKAGVEFWEENVFINRSTKIMVAPEEQNKYEKLVKHKVQSVLVIDDVQLLIDDKLKSQSKSGTTKSYSFERYHTLEEIYIWFDTLIQTYPNIVSSVKIGKSFEGRVIKGVILNFKENEDSEERLIAIIEGGIHAREWIAPATVTWLINEFLTSNDSKIRSLAENFEWHMFPVVNPDGYSYTFTDNRLWRKNRNTAYATTCEHMQVENDMSNGVDLNRNFDIAWMSVGASDDPCSNLYAGPSPASEPETKAIAEYAIDISREGNLIYYFSLHSYSQLFLIPYSHYSTANDIDGDLNYDDMYTIALRGSQQAEKRYGTHYKVGLSADHMYRMSGTSFDYIKNFTDVSLSYLFELRDLGNYGFLLPANQIIPVGLEIMDALVEMDKTSKTLDYYSGADATSFSILVTMLCIIIGRL